MRRYLVALVFVAVPLAATLIHAQPGARSESGLDLSLLDRSVDPCTDFYAYTCGGWTKNQPIPADRSSWGVAERLQEQNETRLRKILEDAAKATDPETKKIGDYYASCMDESRIDARGAAALQPMLDKIAALSSVGMLPLVAELHTLGAGAFFAFGAEADFKEASVVRRSPTRAASACPTATTTSATTEVSGAAEGYSSTSGRCWVLASDDSARRRSRTRTPQHGDEDRDRARQGVARRRRAPRSGGALPPHGPPNCGAHTRVHVEPVLQGRRLAGDRRAERHRAGFLQGVRSS